MSLSKIQTQRAEKLYSEVNQSKAGIVGYDLIANSLNKQQKELLISIFRYKKLRGFKQKMSMYLFKCNWTTVSVIIGKVANRKHL